MTTTYLDRAVPLRDKLCWWWCRGCVKGHTVMLLTKTCGQPKCSDYLPMVQAEREKRRRVMERVERSAYRALGIQRPQRR